jgi:hypothetical protein
MVKLRIQRRKVKAKVQQQTSVCSAKVLDLFLWCPILVLVVGILGFVGEGADPLVGQLVGKMAGGIFFPAFLGLMGNL